jgi:hypothetical protein
MWTEAVETYLEEAPPASSLQARWDQVSALCREKAVQICGALARRTGAPWLAEKETEVKQLDTWISEAQEADRQIRNNPHNLPQKNGHNKNGANATNYRQPDSTKPRHCSNGRKTGSHSKLTWRTKRLPDMTWVLYFAS